MDQIPLVVSIGRSCILNTILLSLFHDSDSVAVGGDTRGCWPCEGNGAGGYAADRDGLNWGGNYKNKMESSKKKQLV